MNKIIKTISLLTLMAVIPGAFAATTARPSYLGSKASPRLSVTRYINQLSTNSTTSSTWYDDVECVENYMSCIKGNDACGSDFEECTTNVLFHAQMPKCLSTLHQCRPSGVGILFGVSSSDTNTAIASLSTVKTYNEHNEVTEYTYPTVGSDLGQMIIAAAEMNKLTKDQCVRRYTNCLEREDVCGADFELCTDNTEFKRHAMLCESTLARCQSDAKIALFGSVSNASNLKPSGAEEDVVLVKKIKDGAALAASNAVKTCKKVTENCLVSACVANPLRCVEGTNMQTVYTADFISTGADVAQTAAIKNMDDGTEVLTASQIRKMLKSSCLETIGGNKYCHMVYMKKAPTPRELTDMELQDEVFALAYSDRKESVNTQIQEELKKFDTNAKNKCIDTIQSCAMSTCGGGIGSVCYSKVFHNKDVGTDKSSINRKNTYNQIRSGCEGVVNNDPYCIYSATASEGDGYIYSFSKQGAFDKLFPLYETGSEKDPIGVVASLNSLLATSYSDVAIDNMKKQCRSVALGCVKSMCGSDYSKCYRLRNDIYYGTYSTGDDTFNKSMNKTGGVLDYNIVIGLCLNTVTTTNACEEHLKIAAAKWTDEDYNDTKTWGKTPNDTSVRKSWVGANSTKATAKTYDDQQGILSACRISEKEHNKNPDNCPLGATLEPENNDCVGIMDNDGCIYDEPVWQSYTDYVLSNAAESLFQELLVDVEKEANGKYNQKLTQEQHVCLNNNEGGIKGANDNGSTFQWVKLTSGKVPKSYATKGLKSNQFKTTGDLYGAFCRARVTVTSDDKNIQELLAKSGETTAYFAVGDTFTCGSWISSKTLEKITKNVQDQALVDAGVMKRDKNGNLINTASTNAKYAWGTVIGALGGGALGVGLSETGVLSKALDKSNKANKATKGSKCVSAANTARIQVTNAGTKKDSEGAIASAISSAKSACISDGISSTTCNSIPLAQWTEGENGSLSNMSAIIDVLSNVQTECEKLKDEDTVDPKTSKNIRWAVPMATTIAGGALAAGITATVIDTQKESIQNEAVKQWMAEIGDHIQCYVGGDELGSYGDTVSLSID